MATRRQRRKQSQDRFGAIGMAVILVIFGGAFYFIAQFSDEPDANKCSTNNGPNGVTAIVFDKSESYSPEQITDIKSSFNSWLSGKEPNIKDRPIDLKFFAEGVLVQLYVTDNEMVSSQGGLKPKAQLCVPKDFEDANFLYSNPEKLKKDLQNFVSTFTNELEKLTLIEENVSPIMETLVRLSNSEDFQKHPDKQHNLLIVSDMLQHSDNYSHYRAGEGTDWNNFLNKMGNSIYTRPNLNEVNYQIFYAIRNNPRDRKLQTTRLTVFWSEFFKQAKSSPSALNDLSTSNTGKPKGWIPIDG